jgi:hypothetical protein
VSFAYAQKCGTPGLMEDAARSFSTPPSVHTALIRGASRSSRNAPKSFAE